MFIITQILLNKFKKLDKEQLPTYTIIYGIVIYSLLYLYVLIYKNEYVSYVYTFSIYIILIDIFLSMLYNWQINQNKQDEEEFTMDENLSTKREDDSLSITLTDDEIESVLQTQDLESLNTNDIKNNIINNIKINDFLKTEEEENETTTNIALNTPLPTNDMEIETIDNNNIKKRRGRPRKTT
jgi:hypothetical protein